jgi:hypothetical protein
MLQQTIALQGCENTIDSDKILVSIDPLILAYFFSSRFEKVTAD